MTPAAIDVLLPVYNAAGTLDAALDSLVTQTQRDFRIIAIDDGSTDASSAILARWASRDARIEVLRVANGGIVAALNAGLARVTAPLIARMDADDLCAPDRFARQRAWLDSNLGCVAVGGRVDHIDADGAPVLGLPQPGPPGRGDAHEIPAREPYIVHPFLMARADAVKRAGGYRPVPSAEDSDLYWRLTDLGDLHNLPDTLGKYRVHGQSVSGASIINGRIMAVGSQLAAVSAHRRRAGVSDLVFATDLATSLRGAETLEAMCAHVAVGLSKAESAWLALAVSVKLMELAAYRPYELDDADCRFARRSLAVDGARAGGHVRWHFGTTALRLARGGALGSALRLLPPRFWAYTVARTVATRHGEIALGRGAAAG